MEMDFDSRKIKIDRELSKLDRFVIDFTSILEKHGVKYVIVSGYVAIIFGRSRLTEDVDIICGKFPKKKFKKIWKDLNKEFDCLNTDDMIDAYDSYLKNFSSIRFSKKGKFIPNIELKFVQADVDKYVLNNSIKVEIGEESLPISPLEIQIAYKLFLGSDKDREDARFLYSLFSKRINREELKEFLRDFEIEKKVVKEFLEIDM